MPLFYQLSIEQVFCPQIIQESICPATKKKGRKKNIPSCTWTQAATSSASLLISVGRFVVTTLKSVSAFWCFRKGSSRANSFLPFETAKKGRNSPAASLLENTAGKKKSSVPIWYTHSIDSEQKHEPVIVHIKSRFRCNSHGLVVLQLWVNVLHFPLILFHQFLFFCLRQCCGFHPIRLLHLQKNYEQLKSRTPYWETRRVKEKVKDMQM